MSQPPSSNDPPEGSQGPPGQQPQGGGQQPPQGQEQQEQPQPQERKGLSPLAWVLIIVGGLLVLSAGACVACGVMFMNTARELADNPARAAAELAVRADPDLEVVESDPDAGTLTVRNTRTGEEATLDFDEIAEGHFSWSTEEGEGGVDVSGEGDEGRLSVRSEEGTTTFGAGTSEDLPQWLPAYPDGEVDSVGMAVRQAERVAGSFQVLTDDGVEAATETWRETLEAAGFAVTVQSMSGTEAGPRSVIVAENEEPERQVSVTVSRDEGRTRMLVQYQGIPE